MTVEKTVIMKVGREEKGPIEIVIDGERLKGTA